MFLGNSRASQDEALIETISPLIWMILGLGGIPTPSESAKSVDVDVDVEPVWDSWWLRTTVALPRSRERQLLIDSSDGHIRRCPSNRPNSPPQLPTMTSKTISLDASQHALKAVTIFHSSTAPSTIISHSSTAFSTTIAYSSTIPSTIHAPRTFC